MEFTLTERLMLSNQFHILELLDPHNAEDHRMAREVVERGIEPEYTSLSETMVTGAEILTLAEGREALDILSMFQALKYGFRELDDKSGIEEDHIQFMGFDGNTEGKYITYTRFLQKTNRFTDLEAVGIDGLNSHMPLLDMYRQMVAAWEGSLHRFRLTQEDIQRIATAVPRKR